MMRLALCPQPLYDRSFGEALDVAARFGASGIELPIDEGSPWFDPARLAAGDCDGLLDALAQRGMALTAVSVHQEGQLLLGPHHEDSDRICGGTPAEKSAFAAERILRAGRIAKNLELDVVVGFVGCEDYSRWFPWPAADGWERMMPVFRERMLPVLDGLAELGVAFAQEPHPKQIVYNTETALESVALLGEHPAWTFNFDPANLMLAGVDPVVFLSLLGDRIRHVHAKDAELVEHNAARSGWLAHGPWSRPDRGFRFRIPGWGQIDWRRIISELIVQRYQGWLSVEHEDPLFGREDGLQKALDMLSPLMPQGEPEERWW